MRERPANSKRVPSERSGEVKDEKEIQKMASKIVGALLALTIFAGAPGVQAVGAQIPERVVPMGITTGIKMFADGIMVVGLSKITTQSGEICPAQQAGLREGDIIISIDGTNVSSTEELQNVITNAAGKTVSMKVLRANRKMDIQLQAVRAAIDETWRIGAWVRDSMAGIGTLTFYDPASGIFGALGHSINDVDTGNIMPLRSGSLMPSSVVGVKRGEAGRPGELKGEFDLTRSTGRLSVNSPSGIFGVLDDASLASGYEPMQVARRGEVKTGKAQILSCVDGAQRSSYDVEIIRIYSENEADERGMMLRVTDPALLKLTGGIVQGMSGSPIVQNGKLIGAVTHVLVNDPKRGYGIFIENMLESAYEDAALKNAA